MTSRTRLAAVFGLSLAIFSPLRSTGQTRVEVVDLVVVTEDRAEPGPGCDAVSVFSITDQEPRFRGDTKWSPGRLAADPGLSVALASPNNREVFLYYLRRADGGRKAWQVGKLTGPPFAIFGGIAVLPDASRILVALNGRRPPPGSHPELPLLNEPPFRVAQYVLPARVTENTTLDEATGVVELSATAVEIILSWDGRMAHIVTSDNHVVTLDVASMARTAADIDLPRFAAPQVPYRPQAENYIHASLSRDGRYLVSNGGESATVRVADLETRQAWTLSLPGAGSFTGGVALNAGWVNSGLLAVHTGDAINVYRFASLDGAVLLGHAAVPSPLRVRLGRSSGPLASVAWSADGRYVVAGMNGTGTSATAEFTLIEVGGGGATLTPVYAWTACAETMNFANDIWTANGHHWPTPTATASPPASATPTPSPTVTLGPTDTVTVAPTMPPTASASPTLMAPPTATPIPTPPREPTPLFLPLALRERCPVDRQHVDVALVIDASTSMRDDRTATGRTKLEAALEAAAAFVDTLALPLNQAAVVGFNSDAWIEQPLTARRTDVEAALASIPAGVREQTRIDLGIAEAHQELLGPRRLPGNRPVMIVLTDGLANPEPVATAVRRAAEAKAVEIPIFTIGLGDEGALNVPQLTQIASRPEYFHHAPHAEDLAAIYRAIAVELPCPGVRLWPGARPTTTAERLRP